MKNFIEYICPLQTYIEEKTLILLSPNNYIKEKIEKNYLSIIKNVIQNISDENYKIKIIIGSIKQNKQTIENIKNIEKNIKNELKNINSFAKSAIFMTIKNPGVLYNPIYIYEEKNTNKNNIINYIINNLINSNKNIKYTIIKNEIIKLENLFKTNKLLIIEEINLIKINLKYQQILQKTLELIIKNNTQLIITANEHFNKLKNINKKTKKLIEHGLIIKIIKNDKHAKIKKQISIDDIIKNTLTYYNMDMEKIKNKKRQKNIVLIRQIIFYLCKTLTNKTFSELSTLLGEYTNSNIMYSYKKIKSLIEKDINIKNDIQNIKNNTLK
jgi:chromosomal replication initiation ATPase DnaA